MVRRSRSSRSSSSSSSDSSSDSSDYEADRARRAASAMAYADHMMRAQDHESGPRATHHKRKALSYLAPDHDVPYVVNLEEEDEMQGELLPDDYVDPTPYSLDMRALVVPDRLVFHSASKHVRVPGTSESVASSEYYAELNGIADWRRTLSNFDVREFEWDGTGVLPVPFPRATRWNTIEHAYHASKYAFVASMCESEARGLNGEREHRLLSRGRLLRRVAATLIKQPGANSDAAQHFNRIKTLTDAYVDSMPFIGNGTGAQAKKRGRDVVLNATELRVWDDVSRDVMESIARAKVLCNPTIQRVLLATRDARLYHLLARVTSVNDANLDRFTHLERIRDELRSDARSGS